MSLETYVSEVPKSGFETESGKENQSLVQHGHNLRNGLIDLYTRIEELAGSRQLSAKDQTLFQEEAVKIIDQFKSLEEGEGSQLDRVFLGFMGEVAGEIAFRQMGFESVFSANEKEDEINHLDFWAEAGGGLVLMVQVKTFSETDQVRVLPAFRLSDEGEIIKNQSAWQAYQGELESMEAYAHQVVNQEEPDPRFQEKPEFIIPLVLELPGGTSRSDSSFNSHSGLPREGLSEEILAKLNQADIFDMAGDY